MVTYHVRANAEAGFDLTVCDSGEELLMSGPFKSADDAEARLYRYLEREKQERIYDEKGTRGGAAK